MANVLDYMTNLESDELMFVQTLMLDMNENQARQFTAMYNARRRDTMLILLTCLAGFLGFAGIHRFIINSIGLGILYFFTGGLCFIGTIIDALKYKSLAFEYNQKIAREIAYIIKGNSPYIQ